MYETRYYWEIADLVTAGKTVWVVDKKDKQLYRINDTEYWQAAQLINRIKEDSSRYVVWSDDDLVNKEVAE